MSLNAIRSLRLGGRKPAVVWVVIGEKPAHLMDDEGMVIVRPSDEPALMDWRPLRGVLASVVDLQADPDRAVRVLDAMQAAGVLLFGMVCGPNRDPQVVAEDGHGHLLRKAWELMQCQ